MISISAADLAIINAGQYALIQGPAVVPTPPPPTPPVTAITMKIVSGKLVDQNGKGFKKGVNCSGLEFVAIGNWSTDPWGGTGQKPSYPAVKSWGNQVVRLPLNEQSWMGYPCYNGNGLLHPTDKISAAVYQAQVVADVKAATAEGLGVILDNHWCAANFVLPGNVSPVPIAPSGQGPMADADHTPAFIASLAATFKSFPNVMIDLHNEPMLAAFGALAPGEDEWTVMANGGVAIKYDNATQGGSNYTITQNWNVAGYQSLIDAARGAGFTGVLMLGCVNWAKDPSGWLGMAMKLKDPLNQLACSVHLYPAYGTTPGTPAYTQPNFAPQVWPQLEAIIAAGYPVVIGETGDHDATGTVGAPFLATVTAWAAKTGSLLLGWGWDIWQDSDNVLILDSTGTPTPGYGQAFKAY